MSPSSSVYYAVWSAKYLCAKIQVMKYAAWSVKYAKIQQLKNSAEPMNYTEDGERCTAGCVNYESESAKYASSLKKN